MQSMQVLSLEYVFIKIADTNILKTDKMRNTVHASLVE